MPVIFWVLYLLAAICLGLAAFGVKGGRVQLGWLGMLLWLMVAVLRAAGAA